MNFSSTFKRGLILAALMVVAESASATTNCVFVTTTKSWKLQASCSTDATIVVPNNISLDGQGFKITAIDPVGGNFTGPIIKNGGKVLNVANLYLRVATATADVCNADGDKIVGILLDRASSNVSNVNITMNKAGGTSTCDEGVAILAQSVPFDTKRSFVKVNVKNSTFNYNQKAALVSDGNVSLRAEANAIKNLNGNPVAQRGIVVSNGSKGYVLNNMVLRHIQTPPSGTDVGYGILLNNAGQSTVLTNTLNYNDIAIAVLGGTKITVRGNIIRSSTADGILISDSNGVVNTKNTIWANDSQKNGFNGIYVQSLFGTTTSNVVKNNILSGNTQNGLLMEGSLNKAQSNNATLNHKAGAGFFDIANAAGATNLYSQNTCDTSSGPPVNCP